MADEIRVTRVGGEEVHRVAGEPAGEEGPLVIDAREEIQATRERISGTIDEIEGALRRKRENIEKRLDILAPVRDRPLQVLGVVFGAGLVLGLLTGGGDEEEEEERPAKGKGRGGRRGRGREEASRWESRTRRLLRIAREQEEEIESLRRRAARRSARAVVQEDGDYEIEDDYDSDRYEDGYGDDDGETGEGRTAMDRLRGFVMEHVSGLAAEAVEQLVRRAGRG